MSDAHDQPGILKSRDYFQGLIQNEINKGIPSSRIVLGQLHIAVPHKYEHLQVYVGGFSQGGAISLFTGITFDKKLAGIFGLSSYLLLHDKIKDYVKTDAPNKHTPIFMGHGNADQLVRYKWGQDTAAMLTEMGLKVDLRTYEGLGHSADPKEIDDLEAYLAERLPPLQ